MIQILIVDDNVPRLEQLREILGKAEIPEHAITSVGSVSKAKQHLSKIQFHILILDLVLPAWDGEKPEVDGGSRLLKEIIHLDLYHTPGKIFVLSEFEEAMQALEDIRSEVDCTPIKYNASDDDWRVRLETYMKQALGSEVIQHKTYHFDAAVICALEEPELSEVKRLPFEWKTYAQLDDPIDYFVGSVEGRKVVCAASYEMGLSAAAILASKMIARFRPQYLIMTGIAGGVDRKKLSYGDIMVADPCFDYESGKKVFEHGKSVFKPDYRQIRLNESVNKMIRRLKFREAELQKIYDEFEGEKPNHPPKIEIGPFGSGASVLSDPNVIARVQMHNRKFMGFDMEAYAVMLAGRLSAEPKTISVVMKSVSDFGNGKTDKYQKYAAYTSAKVLALLLQELFGE